MAAFAKKAGQPLVVDFLLEKQSNYFNIIFGSPLPPNRALILK